MGKPLFPFRVRTTQREVVIEAESVAHAHALFTGKVWPPGAPPAPRPANRVIPDSGGMHEATPEWSRWYEEDFLPLRARYPVLAWGHGECMLSVDPVEAESVTDA